MKYTKLVLAFALGAAAWFVVAELVIKPYRMRQFMQKVERGEYTGAEHEQLFGKGSAGKMEPKFNQIRAIEPTTQAE